ncbi:uncharacterized protein H6S33_011962 [Morchella sextelata]|uniref:uncharacterized protein n=1 Tax=Morchella sextelata TaxID=1174677 RepID=UPI001D03A761|nr:uncharacterized protein H6S33_011962 [Morchella sextelata]KAH0610435.1 hypothetical protein H6S33_011962 [Morchella sextelata]
MNLNKNWIHPASATTVDIDSSCRQINKVQLYTVYTSPSARLKPIQFARHRAASKGPSCCNTSAKEPSGCMLLFCPFFFFCFVIDRLKAIPKRAQPNVASFRPSSVNIPLPTAVQPDKLANRMVIVIYSVQFFQLTQQNFLKTEKITKKKKDITGTRSKQVPKLHTYKRER